VASTHDPRVAVRVRQELIRRRRDGKPWSDRMYDLIVKKALIGSSNRERSDWYAAFSATRQTWRSAYEREIQWDSRLNVELLEREPGEFNHYEVAVG
jgi:hypothetical protein